VALILGACSAATTVPLPASGPLVIVETRGGLCPEGTCGQVVILERDGRVHLAAKPPNDLGRVDAAAYMALDAAIRTTDFVALRSRPFTGECPTAFDGQEIVFEFSLGATTERIASCEVEIDWGSPLFVALGVALGAWIPVPLS